MLEVISQHVFYGCVNPNEALRLKRYQAASHFVTGVQSDAELEEICAHVTGQLARECKEYLDSGWEDVFLHGCIFVNGLPCFFYTAWHGTCPSCMEDQPGMHFHGHTTPYGMKYMSSASNLPKEMLN